MHMQFSVAHTVQPAIGGGHGARQPAGTGSGQPGISH
jgi:hypothetical protein